MNDQTVADIQKHNNKVTRILNKLCEKYVGLTQEIDLALYSCLKIQKIIKKHHQNHKNDNGNNNSNQIVFLNANGQSGVSLNQEDQLYANALNIIDGFRTATRKLQNKVGILLRQQELSKQVQKAKKSSNMNAYDEALSFNPNVTHSRDGTTKAKRKQISAYENTSPFSPHIINNQSHQRQKQESSGKRNKSTKENHRKRIKEYMQESQSFEQMDEGHKSKNISELDLEIIQLASQIKNLIKQN